MSNPMTDAEILEALRETSRLAAENERLKARSQNLHVALDRLISVTETFIRDTSDPGTEALAAVYCARKEINKHV